MLPPDCIDQFYSSSGVQAAEMLMLMQVACTALGVNHCLLKGRIFDMCIMDEAGQMTLPVALGPILHSKYAAHAHVSPDLSSEFSLAQVCVCLCLCVSLAWWLWACAPVHLCIKHCDMSCMLWRV